MLVTLDRHNGIPAYRQIIDQIRFGVASGLLAAGDELPSTRTLAAELSSNPMTISKAYGMLEREGLLLRRPGLPLVVASSDASDDRSATADKERREAELAKALEPVAAIARRLGISPTRARLLLGQSMERFKNNEENNS